MTRAVPQHVRWVVHDAMPAGIKVECEELGQQFIPWRKLKPEIEANLIPYIRIIPVHSIVEVADFEWKKDWIVIVLTQAGEEMGHVWFGEDPNREWAWDGMVHIGPAMIEDVKPHRVWQTFQRYSNGTYIRIKNFLDE